MYDYQKYLISKLNDVYQQIRLNSSLPFSPKAKEFLLHTPKCTNLAQVYTINVLIFQPLKKELNLNHRLYANDLHLSFNDWINHFEALIAVDRVFNKMFEIVLLNTDTQTLNNLLILNSTELTRVLVSLVVEFRDQFLQIKMTNFLNLVHEFNSKDYILNRDWDVLNDSILLIQNFYQDLKKVRTNTPNNYDKPTAIFLQSAQYWVYYLQAILVITFQVLVNANLETLAPNLKLTTVYEVLETF